MINKTKVTESIRTIYIICIHNYIIQIMAYIQSTIYKFRSAFIMSAAFLAIMMIGALVFPDIIQGIMEASTTRSVSTPFTLNLGSTTVLGSSTDPILHVPTG